MSLTYTPKSENDLACPEFSLPDVFGKTVKSSDFKNATALCVLFICNHCPYVKAIEDRLLELARSFKGQPVQFLGICSNDSADYPEDAPPALKARALEKSYPFPYLVDESQAVAKAFGAVCTPDIFVFDATRKLHYRGRLDDSWRDPSRVTRQELKGAIESLLAQKPSPHEVLPSMGCSIKWKS